MRNQWRRLAKGLLLGGMLLSSAACAGPGIQELNSYMVPPEQVGDDTQTIELAMTKSSKNAIFVSEAVTSKFEKQTGIRVKLQLLPTEQVSSVLKTKLAVGEAPDLILYNLNTAAFELNLENNFEALDGEPWAPRLVSRLQLSYNGRMYGFHLTQDAGQQGIVYNKKIFRRLGLKVPQDFEELLKVCEAIKAAGITPFFMPFKDAWATELWTSSAFADYAKKNDPMLWSDINAGRRKSADIPALTAITQQQYDLYKLGYTNGNVLRDSYDMAVDKFIGEGAAMMTMGDWFIAEVLQKDPSMDLGLFPVPYARGADLAISPLGGQLFIPKKAKHMAEAKRFLEFLASKEVAQEIIDRNNFISNLRDVATPEQPAYKQEIFERYIKPGRTVMTAASSQSVDPGDKWKYLQDMFAGGITAHEVWVKWDKRFEQLMKEKQALGFW